MNGCVSSSPANEQTREEGNPIDASYLPYGQQSFAFAYLSSYKL